MPVATRVALIEKLAQAGLPRIEIGSFVNPKQVPQMAGMDDVARLTLERVRLQHPKHFTALVPNMRGYELATTAGLRQVRLVLAASEALNQANFRRSVAQSLADFAAIAARARADNAAFGVAVGAAFGCPFTGHVTPGQVLAIAQQLVDLGADEIVLADTTGMAVPSQVHRLCVKLIAVLYPDTAQGEAVASRPTVTVHFHNTRNTGYANAYAALEAGIRSFDAALGGIGGCPFAPRAVGNIATEDLVHMFNGMGVETGIDLAALLDASNWLSEQMGKSLPALVGKAGPVFDRVNMVS